ncbi:MAG TPA: hypothetical protein VMF32_23040 [Xanthobacteraceae bacterium]|nr:hypothetical protein [Xanthobacteraceae bacterium]
MLGLHPVSQGFGWALFDGPDSLFDWGTADIRKGDNVRALLRAAQLFDKYRPPLLILEEFDGTQSRRQPRLRLLCRAVVARAELRNMRVHRYAREEIAAALFPARTRYEIALAVAARLEHLQLHVPKKRKVWERERLAMSVFCAAACVLSYYAARSA